VVLVKNEMERRGRGGGMRMVGDEIRGRRGRKEERFPS
jgi:hypothetical protein